MDVPASHCKIAANRTRSLVSPGVGGQLQTEKEMPKLPVATAFRTPEPNLQTGAEAWILAGGAHHTAFSYDLTAEQMGDWAAEMGIEAVYIDKDTTIRNFKNELLWNSVAYRK